MRCFVIKLNYSLKKGCLNVSCHLAYLEPPMLDTWQIPKLLGAMWTNNATLQVTLSKN
jgi:hypothetical protein